MIDAWTWVLIISGSFVLGTIGLLILSIVLIGILILIDKGQNLYIDLVDTKNRKKRVRAGMRIIAVGKKERMGITNYLNFELPTEVKGVMRISRKDLDRLTIPQIETLFDMLIRRVFDLGSAYTSEEEFPSGDYILEWRPLTKKEKALEYKKLD